MHFGYIGFFIQNGTNSFSDLWARKTNSSKFFSHALKTNGLDDYDIYSEGLDKGIFDLQRFWNSDSPQ